MSSTAKHRAEPPAQRSAGRHFTPMLIAMGGLIALSGVIAGGAGILGLFRL